MPAEGKNEAAMEWTTTAPVANGVNEEPVPQEHSGRRKDDPPLKILDALSATGLRALRYAKELPMATSVTANDLSPSAAAAIRDNVEYNRLKHQIQI